jgi:REP element-mobilizing transposase RayT
VYHCFNRCVRRAFLYGFDALTGRDFSHRKAWLVDRLRGLAAIFALEVCAYAVLEKHYHVILRTRPDIAANWSDREVATRWLHLFPRHRAITNEAIPPTEREICALTDCPERIVELRDRLRSLSWFMACLNESIARAANKEDNAKGRFWESRFKCQVLLDEAAVAACMVYVDLNPIRAGLAASPEQSDFTSVQERIRAWQNEKMAASCVPGQTPQDSQFCSRGSNMQILENAGKIGTPIPEQFSCLSNFSTAQPFLPPGYVRFSQTRSGAESCRCPQPSTSTWSIDQDA